MPTKDILQLLGGSADKNERESKARMKSQVYSKTERINEVDQGWRGSGSVCKTKRDGRTGLKREGKQTL